MNFDPLAFALGPQGVAVATQGNSDGGGASVAAAVVSSLINEGGGGGNPRLPPEYQEVAYLANDGNCWCSIAVKPKKDEYCEIIIDFASDTPSTENGIIGIPQSTNGKAWEIWYSNGSVGFYNGITANTVNNVVANTKYTFIGQFTLSNSSYAGDFNWGRYSTGSYPYKGKMYSCRIYSEDGEIQEESCNLVPCYRKADNVPGFYDVINSVFYTNAGSGTFGIGPDV